MSNQAYPSAVRSGSFTGDDNVKVPGMRGVQAVIDVTAVPGVDTVTMNIQWKDKTSGKYTTILSTAAIVATSTITLRIAPGGAVTANVSANDEAPDIYRVTVTHSAGTNFTYSIGVTELP